MLQKASNKVDGVLAANDGLGNAAISALKQRKLKQIPVTGQDATLQGIQNIVNGDQCMTVYKAIKKEADAAAALAVSLAKGETPTGVDRHGQQREPRRPVDPAQAGRRHEGQHQGVPRRGRLPQGRRDLRGQARDQVQGARAVMTPTTDGGGSRERPSGAVPLLELKGVSKRFGAVQALHEVDFDVRAGEVTALVGDNGAGKSVTIKCIAGIYPIDERRDLLGGQAGLDQRPEGRLGARHRGRLPGPRARRQPRRRAEHVPRPRGGHPAARARRDEDGAALLARRSARCRSRRSARCARPSPACPAASASRSRSPRPSCGTRASSSSTSRPPRSASPRRARCSTSSGASPTRASRSCSSPTTCTTSSRSPTTSRSCASARTSRASRRRTRPSARSSRRSPPASSRPSPARRRRSQL